MACMTEWVCLVPSEQAPYKSDNYFLHLLENECLNHCCLSFHFASEILTQQFSKMYTNHFSTLCKKLLAVYKWNHHARILLCHEILIPSHHKIKTDTFLPLQSTIIQTIHTPNKLCNPALAFSNHYFNDIYLSSCRQLMQQYQQELKKKTSDKLYHHCQFVHKLQRLTHLIREL